MRTTRILAVAAAAALAVGLSACSTGTPDATADLEAGSPAGGGFPVTIEHAFGETTIPQQPERVVAVGSWANQEVPLALGVVPVGMSRASWGDDDDNGVMPWVEDALTDLGVDVSLLGDAEAEDAGEVPVLFDETDGLDYEAVADTRPDVILSSYSGITQEEYDTLSKIAPVVAYPEVAWGTSVEDMTIMNATAIGLADEGRELAEQLRDETEAAFDAHPALSDASVLFAFIGADDLSQLGYYTAVDTRPAYLYSLGMPVPQIVTDNADSDAFYLTVSSERADLLADVDLFIAYGDESLVTAMQADPLLATIPAVAEGRIALLTDDTPLASGANPSPLSIPYNFDEYLDVLEAPLLGR